MWYCTKNCEDSLLDSFFMSILEAFHFLPIYYCIQVRRVIWSIERKKIINQRVLHVLYHAVILNYYPKSYFWVYIQNTLIRKSQKFGNYHKFEWLLEGEDVHRSMLVFLRWSCDGDHYVWRVWALLASYFEGHYKTKTLKHEVSN